MHKDIYIAWVPFQRRLDSMQPFFGYQTFYVVSQVSSPRLKLLDYLIKSAKTVQIILSNRPKVIWLQLPPTFLVHLVMIACALSGIRARIVLDCHNATFRGFWSKIPGLRALMRRADACVVHNEEVVADCAAMGVAPTRIVVLEDPPAPFTDVATSGHDYILVPCSFHDDEPIHELLDAARLLVGRKFYITGNRARAESKGFVAQAPDNVVFTGFVPTEEFDSLLRNAGLVLGLTKYEGIQLSVANEAVGAGQALVLSRTVILQKLFSEAAIFCENTAQGLADAVHAGFANREELVARSRALKLESTRSWETGAARLRADLHSGENGR